MTSFERPMSGRITDNADIGQEYRRRIGRHIARLRREVNLTGRELGVLVGIGTTAISAIETGRNPVPPERYEDFARALKVPREEFGRFLLQHTNPWLYAMLFDKRRVSAEIVKIPDRTMDLRE